jgi:hypothetical protein
VEIKCQLETTDEFLLQILLLAKHVWGHLYAHHQELESIIQVLSSPQTGHTTVNSTLYRQLENQAPNTTDSNHLYNTLELLMMSIKVSETCFEQAIRSAIKIHLLFLVGILFPHIFFEVQ